MPVDFFTLDKYAGQFGCRSPVCQTYFCCKFHGTGWGENLKFISLGPQSGANRESFFLQGSRGTACALTVI